jgi:hypothetical protein
VVIKLLVQINKLVRSISSNDYLLVVDTSFRDSIFADAARHINLLFSLPVTDTFNIKETFFAKKEITRLYSVLLPQNHTFCRGNRQYIIISGNRSILFILQIF